MSCFSTSTSSNVSYDPVDQSSPNIPSSFQEPNPQKEMMTAIFYNRQGSPNELVVDRVYQPNFFRKVFVLVKVMASSINPIDWKLRAGHIPSMLLGLPHVPGLDFSGVVVKVGDLVTDFQAGDEVMGVLDPLDTCGACSEFIQIHQRSVVKKPHNISHVEAASLGVVGVISLQAVVERGELREGQRVLIHGGSGGVGTIAIQLARHLGASDIVVTCTCKSPEDSKVEQLLTDLGATRVIDYRNLRQNLSAIGIEDGYFDLIIDTQSGDTLAQSWALVKPSTGKIVSLCVESDRNVQQNIEKYGSKVHVFPALFKAVYLKLSSAVLGPTYITIKNQPTQERLSKIMMLASNGDIKPVIDRIIPFSLNAVKEAHEILERGHIVRGKIVIDFNLRLGDEIQSE